ncbi:hypothetical protein LguiB_015299 [Lonicera macranthoides]
MDKLWTLFCGESDNSDVNGKPSSCINHALTICFDILLLATLSAGFVTSFTEAGFFSIMSFWWLNPLMTRGRGKTLEDEDIPKLREADQAESCYFQFMDQINKQKEMDPSSEPLILRAIILCHGRDIFISGVYAFFKIITLSAGPLLFNAFIMVAEGLATIAALVVIVLTVLCNIPLAKLQHRFQSKLMVAQDARLKASSEALINMKILKLYAWEAHVKNIIENLRKLRKAYTSILFWSSLVLVSTVTFGTCYFLGIPLYASNVFTFVATVRLVQDPVRTIPEVIGVVIQAKVSFARILKFHEASELESANIRQKRVMGGPSYNISIKSANLSWEENTLKPTLRNINLEVKLGEKFAVCGEVGSGKSTLLAAILGEVTTIMGTSAWIQSGTIQENILFGSPLDVQRYKETLEKCSLVKDLDRASTIWRSN